MSDTNKVSNTGASLQATGLKHRLAGWAAHHQLVAVETFLRLLRHPVSSALTLLVVAISLTLPGALWMALDNAQQLSSRFQESGRVTLYLSPSTSTSAGQTLSEQIRGLQNVADVEFIDAATALEDFRQHSGLDAALDFLTENPLPALILVEPPLGLDTEQTQRLLEQLRSYPAVDSVQVDMAWVERLRSLLSFAERLILVLGLLLAMAIVLVVGNTIRLAIAARVDEIRVVKLVGGTDAWVRRPFLYTGLWYGMIGGVLSWILLIICWLILRGPVLQMAALYGSSFSLKPLSADAALTLLLGAMLLGWLGAWWSVHRHLKEIEP